MKILQLSVAVVLASLVVGCKTLDELRREEIAQKTEKMRQDIQQLVSENKYAQACEYAVPSSSDSFVRSALTKNLADMVAEIVCPAWATYECTELKSKVDGCLAIRNFAEARECVWCRERTGKTQVDERVSVLRRKLLTGDINMAELEYVRKFMGDVTDKAIRSGSVQEVVAARKTLNSYPPIRTYTEKLDVRLDELAQAMKLIGVTSASADSVLYDIKKKLADCFVDTMGSFKRKDGPDTSMGFARWEDFKAELGKYGCTEVQISDIARAFDTKIKSIIDEAANDARGPAEAVELGTTAIIERLNDTRKACLERLLSNGVRFATDELVSDVEKCVVKRKFAEARRRIIEAPAFGDYELDAKFYRIRIGVLNSHVNPVQSEALIAELEEMVGKEVNAKNFVGAEKIVREFKGIDDRESYAKLFETMKPIRARMRDLAINDGAADAYIGAMTVRALNQINSQEFNETVERDYTKLASVIREFAIAYSDIIHDTRTGFRFAGQMYNTIKSGSLPVDEQQSISTHVANIRIDEARVKMLDLIQQADKNYTTERNKYRSEYTAKVRRDRLASAIFELDHVSETAAAVKAIELQLSENPKGADSMGPVLGEYARLMRKWHDGNNTMSDDEALSILAGAIYLNEPEVFKFAYDNVTHRKVLNKAPESDPLRRPPLLLALKYRRQEFIKMLTDSEEVNVDASIRDERGDTLLHYFAEGSSRKQLDLFKKCLDVVGTTNKVGETALFSAARADNAQMVEAVVGMIQYDDTEKQRNEREKFVKRTNARGETAFTVAASVGACEAMAALQKLGLKPSEKDLAAAAAGNHLEAVKWLVARGVKINAKEVGSDVMSVVPAESETEKYLVRQGGVKVNRTVAPSQERIKLEATLQKSVDKGGK